MAIQIKTPSFVKKGVILLAILALALVLIPVRVTNASAAVSLCNVPNTLVIPGTLGFALKQGGNITFSCSGTMSLPDSFTVTKNTTIDGAGQNITISGNLIHRIFEVKPGVTLTLKNITLTRGAAYPNFFSPADRGGAIVNDGGHLVLNTVTMKNNLALYGGAIFNHNYGSVNITNSYFYENSTLQGSYWHSYNGGAIYMDDGQLNLSNTDFVENTAYFGGAIFNHAANVTISNGLFSQNKTQKTDNVQPNNSDSENTATSVDDAPGASGGAIFSNQPLNISGTYFYGNTADYSGGAIVTNGGELNNLNFNSNKVTDGNGGAIKNFGTLYLNNSVLINNTAHNGEGGAIYNTLKASLVIVKDSFVGNSSNYSGGAISSRGNYMDISSSTFDSNSAATYGGAIYQAKGLVYLRNTTLYDNTAAKGSQLTVDFNAEAKLWNDTMLSDKTPANSTLYNVGKVTLTNTIVSNYTNSTNCAGTAVVDGGNNLQFPQLTCGMMTSKDPLLASLSNNGGPVQTVALNAGSPAIDAGSNTVCGGTQVNNLDARGFSRPVDGDNNGTATCDIGAYEYNAKAK